MDIIHLMQELTMGWTRCSDWTDKEVMKDLGGKFQESRQAESRE
jgi:hypothetical protein